MYSGFMNHLIDSTQIGDTTCHQERTTKEITPRKPEPLRSEVKLVLVRSPEMQQDIAPGAKSPIPEVRQQLLEKMWTTRGLSEVAVAILRRIFRSEISLQIEPLEDVQETVLVRPRSDRILGPE